MNSLERVRLAVRGDMPDRVPIGPYVANWAARWSGIRISRYCTDGRAMARAQLAAWERLGHDIIFPDSDNYYLAEGLGCKTEIPEDDLPHLPRPPVERFEQVFDIPVPEPERDGRMPVTLEAIERIHAQVGDEVAIRVPGTGPFSLAAHMVGIETLLLELALIQRGDETHREALECLLDLTTEALIRFGLAEIRIGAHIVQCGDSVASGSLISPEMYRTWVLPRHQKVFQTWKAAGALTTLHVCGDNARLLEWQAQSGADIVAIDQIVDLGLAKKAVGDRVCLIGNVDPIWTILYGTPATVEVQARQCLEAAAAGGRYILGTGCEVPFEAPVENLDALVRVGKAHSYSRT